MTEKIIQSDLEWKTNEMPHACWGSALDESDLWFNMYGADFKLPRVQEMLVMGSLLPNEADTRETPHEQSAVSDEERKCTSTKILDIPERGTHERYNHKVQSSLLSTTETGSWTKELADTPHGFESQCLEMSGTMKQKSDKVPLGNHRQTLNRRARQKFVAHNGTCIEKHSSEAHLELWQRRCVRKRTMEHGSRCQNPCLELLTGNK